MRRGLIGAGTIAAQHMTGAPRARGWKMAVAVRSGAARPETITDPEGADRKPGNTLPFTSRVTVTGAAGSDTLPP